MFTEIEYLCSQYGAVLHVIENLIPRYTELLTAWVNDVAVYVPSICVGVSIPVTNHSYYTRSLCVML